MVQAAAAQEGSTLTRINLASLEAFHAPGANWRLASAAGSDRSDRHSLVPTEGSGILVNLPSETARTNLFTAWQHGDLELALEFMMPKGSNAGVYLQGRYEVQLFDSWQVSNPGFGDMGGLYQRWDEVARRGYEGHPPRSNASRAPGLWQSLHIVFRAPRFDAAGKKIAHARFEIVTLNGAVLHQNVTVTGPTRAAAFADERPLGPLMIQGDHGPVALRNIRYKHYGGAPVATHDVTYRLFEGDHLTVSLMESPTEEGSLESLAAHNIGVSKPLLIEYQGQISVPTSGRYQFTVALDWITGDPHFRDRRIGRAELTTGNELVVLHDTNATAVTGGTVLQAGAHPFTFAVHKFAGGRPPGITLTVEGPDTPVHALMQARRRGVPAAPIPVRVAGAPTVLRGFVDHDGRKRTHAVSIGDPSGVHYSIDLASAALLFVWRGVFLDATGMWHNRGHDQLVVPQGSVLALSGHPAIVWPGARDSLRSLGYRMDEHEQPVFLYSMGPLQITDQLTPADTGPYLWRTLTFDINGAAPEELWVEAARGSSIQHLREGAYEVEDRTYYVEVLQDAHVRPEADASTLMLPVRFEDGAARITYAIVW